MEILLMQQKSWGEYGQSFCFLYAELRGTIVYAYEKKWWDYLVCAELFLEIILLSAKRNSLRPKQ